MIAINKTGAHKACKINGIRIRGTDPALHVVFFTFASLINFPQTNRSFLAPKMKLCPDEVICTNFPLYDAHRANIFFSKREKSNTRWLN